jgi:hypothetical protein
VNLCLSKVGDFESPLQSSTVVITVAIAIVIPKDVAGIDVSMSTVYFLPCIARIVILVAARQRVVFTKIIKGFERARRTLFYAVRKYR